MGIRFTPEERFLLVIRAAKLDMSVSEYIRSFALTGRVTVNKAANDVPNEVIFELNKIGTNLNQIARVMNKGAGPPPDLSRLCRSIERYILEQITNGAPPR